ncbi:hypothetical protein HOO68_05590 [Candidatus Gracilibacteria bacterium]|nr:hypothetical protein [Candidatus Gracilibacteria bacterium]
MGNGVTSSIIEIPIFSSDVISGLNQQSLAPFLAHRYNTTMFQVIQNAQEYQKLIEEAHKNGWDAKMVREIIFGSNTLLDSTHVLFGTEKDFGKK